MIKQKLKIRTRRHDTFRMLQLVISSLTKRERERGEERVSYNLSVINPFLIKTSSWNFVFCNDITIMKAGYHEGKEKNEKKEIIKKRKIKIKSNNKNKKIHACT